MRFIVIFAVTCLANGSALANDIEQRLATASLKTGERMAQVCKACHSVAQGAEHKVGPNLWGVVGNAVASAAGYTGYSPALKAFGGKWTVDRFDQFLADPTGTVKGTAMAYPGVTDPNRRADLIAYLNSNSSSPLTFAAPNASVPEQRAKADDVKPSNQFGVLFAAPGAEVTYYACSGCHSERIVAQQGLSRDQWDELLDWMVEEQGMDELNEKDRTEILDYLGAHYNTDRPNFPK